jgi:Transposase DDE domain
LLDLKELDKITFESRRGGIFGGNAVRILTKPSTACCNLDQYICYLLSEPQYSTCSKLSKIMGNVSHDSINRFLERENFTAEDLFCEVKPNINLTGGTLSADDSVLDKPYSDHHKSALVEYFWSGKHKRVVKGINLVTLYYTDVNEVSVPVNYRVVDKKEGKTKNDYFREMVQEVLKWGLKPAWVTGDSWYASLDNLKFLRKQKLSFLFGMDSNRLISIEKGSYIQVQLLEDLPESGRVVYLKEYGNVKVFRQLYKNVYRHYLMSIPDVENMNGLTRSDFKRVHSHHFGIECFHRAIKQVCNIERFYVRRKRMVMNHIFCAIGAFVRLEFLRAKQAIDNWYQVQRDLFMDVIKQFILKGGYQPSLKKSYKDIQTQRNTDNAENGKQNSHDGYTFVQKIFSKFWVAKSERFVNA